MSEEQDLAGPADQTAVLLSLLKQAAAAHGIYEAQVLGGVHDVEWPQWYADHIARTMAEAGYRLVRVAPSHRRPTSLPPPLP
ncbi:MAG: hypothetical protein WBA73_15890 [Devosia sp.]